MPTPSRPPGYFELRSAMEDLENRLKGTTVVAQHFKGDEYIITGLVWDATRDEPVIEYRMLSSNKRYTRTPEDWFSSVYHDHQWRPRYLYREVVTRSSVTG